MNDANQLSPRPELFFHSGALDPGAFRVAGMRGFEGLSQLYEIELDLALAESEPLDSDSIEEILGESIVPEAFFCHVCGYDGTCKAGQAALEPRGFVDRRNKRGDGSYDIKIESYG